MPRSRDLPPQFGLYCAIVPAIVAALWGSSWHLVSGPTNALSLVVFATIAPLALPGSGPLHRARAHAHAAGRHAAACNGPGKARRARQLHLAHGDRGLHGRCGAADRRRAAAALLRRGGSGNVNFFGSLHTFLAQPAESRSRHHRRRPGDARHRRCGPPRVAPGALHGGGDDRRQRLRLRAGCGRRRFRAHGRGPSIGPPRALPAIVRSGHVAAARASRARAARCSD